MEIMSYYYRHGSEENLITKGLSKTLGLEEEEHPNSYKVGWIKGGGEMWVTKTCKVPILIGKKYADVVECDVVEMDCCDLIFGRFWLYDTDAIHRGRSNSYEFMWGKTKIILMPGKRKSPEGSGNMETKNVFHTVGGRELQEHLGEENEGLALILKEKM